MWFWLSLCLVSTVFAQNDIFASGTTGTPNKSDRANEEVLLKLWTILADILDADGKTIKVPSRDHIQFALTLIKKTILENKDTNVDIKEKLFLREAELAKYKGIYIHDSRPLQTLLGLDLIPDQKSNVIFKYEIRANNKPNCTQAFQELIQRLHENYNNLANSPICSEEPNIVQSPQNSVYNPVHANQLNPNMEPLSNAGNVGAIWNVNKNIGSLIQTQNRLRVKGEVTGGQVIGAPQVPVLNTNEQTNLLHAVKLSKDTHHIIGNDYSADLEHAKKVADRINALYQTVTPPLVGLYPRQPLRELNTNLNLEAQNNPWVSSQNSRPVMQSGYITENLVNPLINGWNQSYTIFTNNLQSQTPMKNVIVTKDYTNPSNAFVNAKYHPNPAHDNESTTKELPGNVGQTQQTNVNTLKNKLSYNFQLMPNQDKENVTDIPETENILQYPPKTPTRTYAQPSAIPNNNNLNYNIYPYLKPQNNLQNSNENKPGYNPYGMKPNYYNKPYQYYSQVSALRPSYARGYNNYMLQQSLVQPQGKLFTMSYINQNPNTMYGQQIVQNIPPPIKTYKVNMSQKPVQNYAYGMTRIQTSVPEFTHSLNYYNGQPVIDKLADWVSGTNSAKLNSDSDDAEVELTYLIKKPPPMYNPTMFYIKFRMPYKSFAKHITELLKPQTVRSASPDTDLYTNVASQYNGTVVPSDMPVVPEAMKSPEDKLLVRARYIEPNELGNNPNSVDIINLVKEPEANNEDVSNPVNLIQNNNQKPILRN